MADILDGIEEVEECGKTLANFYLDKGYRLLSIQPAVREGRLSNGNPFVAKFVLHVVGRPAGVAHVDRPPRAERAPTPSRPTPSPV